MSVRYSCTDLIRGEIASAYIGISRGSRLCGTLTLMPELLANVRNLEIGGTLQYLERSKVWLFPKSSKTYLDVKDKAHSAFSGTNVNIMPEDHRHVGAVYIK